jgi:hypothetical protein
MVGNNKPFSLRDTSEYINLLRHTQTPSPFVEAFSPDRHLNHCFCRPDLMKHWMGDVISFAMHACSGIAPEGIKSAIVNYCSRKGFAATTLVASVAGTTTLPLSVTTLHGASFQVNSNIYKMFTAIWSRLSQRSSDVDGHGGTLDANSTFTYIRIRRCVFSSQSKHL